MTDRFEQEADRRLVRDVGYSMAFSTGVGAAIGTAESGLQGAIIGASIGAGIIPCVLGTGVGALVCREQYLRSIGLDSRTLRIRQQQEESERAYTEMTRRNQNVNIQRRNVILFENPDETYFMATVPRSRQTGTFINPLTVPQTQEFDQGRMIAQTPFGGRLDLETGEEFKKGGFVKRTGLAKVHRGEYVVPISKIKKCNVCK
jgi:hypothetical protein